MPLPSWFNRRASVALLCLVGLLTAGLTARGQSGFTKPGKLGSGKPLAEFKFALVAGDAESEARFEITATIPAGYYIYAINDDGGPETRVNVKDVTGLEPIDDKFTPDHAGKPYYDPNLETNVEKFYEHVVWAKRYRITGTDKASISGQVVYQICDENNCRPNIKAPFDVVLAANEKPKLEEEEEPEPDSPPSRATGEFVPNLIPGAIGGSKKPVPEFEAQLLPIVGNDEMMLEIDVKIPSGFYIYSTGHNGGAETKIRIDEAVGLEPLDDAFSPDHDPKVEANEARLDDDESVPRTIEKFADHVKWTRRYRKTTDAKGDAPVIRGLIDYQICGDGVCRILKKPFSTDGKEYDPNARPTRGGTDDQTVPGVVSTTENRPTAAAEGQAGKAKGAAGYQAQGLPLFLLAAFGAGFLALLTPCVFPMVPITVSFFQKQSEKQHHKPITMATVYCLGIIGTFTVLGLVMSIFFGPGALTTIANNSFVNLFIAGVLVFFGLNLLGMFELRMPGWLLTYTSSQEGRGGFVGVLFMALTFTLTSFTCTFAFVGGLLVAAAQGDRLWPTLGLLAFSAAFSLPFFFLALFPSFLQKLPRSGGWMNVVKVVMGLIEVGAAFKFFNVADLSWNGQAVIFDYHVVMSAWVIVSIATGMYLLGIFRLPHDVAVESIGVLRFMTAMSFLGLASYLSVGLFAAEKPQGKVWQYIQAFAAPQLHLGEDPTGPYSEHGGLKYALDFERAMDFAIQQNKPLFLDFTGLNCTNCRYMEKGTMSKPEIEDRLKRFVRVQLFTDRVPLTDTKEAERLYAINVKLQERWFGDVTLPSYVVIPPDREALKDPSRILSSFLGAGEEAAFGEFLDKGWNSWQGLAKGGNRAVGKR